MNTPTPGANGPSFRNLGIAPNLLTVLDKIAYTTPTPIQEQAILPAIEGKDIVGIAQTGTGKTLAFGIPVIQGLLGERDSMALIVVPTRELALQVEETIVKVGGPLGIRPVVLIGGAPMRPQVSALRRYPRIIIATPGRLIDHMEQKNLSLDKVKFLVLDEADRMLDMGFLPSIKQILAVMPTERQTLLFSATLSGEIMNIATKAMKLPLQIEIAPQGTTAANITQEIFIVRRDDKLRLLEKVLSDYKGSAIIFTRTKHGATKVAYKVMHMGHTAAEIHSNRSLNQRKAALEGFKTGRYRVLVATDIVARGIDVKNIELVINFDLPSQSEDYVHRIGRTARAGAKGHAISFATPDERRDIKDIERLIRKPIKLTPTPTDLPGVSEVGAARSSSYEGHNPRSGAGRSSSSRPPFRSGSSRPSSGGRPSFGPRTRSEFSKPGHYAPRSASSPRSSTPRTFTPRQNAGESSYEGSAPARVGSFSRAGSFSKPSFSKSGSSRSSSSRFSKPGFSKPGFSRGAAFSKPAGEETQSGEKRSFRPQRTSGPGRFSKGNKK
jgi:ATP-dependent RNA helicase RhlE